MAFMFSFWSCSYEPYTQGKRLYQAFCSNCHMDNGEGLRSLYPPLANSDYLEKNHDQLACIIANGISCLLYTSPSPRDLSTSRMPSSA